MTDNMVLMWKDLMSTLFSCFDEKLMGLFLRNHLLNICYLNSANIPIMR